MEKINVNGIKESVIENKLKTMTEKQKQEIINNAEAMKDLIKVCNECGVSEISFNIKRNLDVKVNVGIQIKELVCGVKVDVNNGIEQNTGFRLT